MEILRITKYMLTENHCAVMETSVLLSATADMQSNTLFEGLAVSLLVE
jgi:hypothetical protein